MIRVDWREARHSLGERELWEQPEFLTELQGGRDPSGLGRERERKPTAGWEKWVEEQMQTSVWSWHKSETPPTMVFIWG